MAIYRNVQMSFWTDPKVLDAFTPEDKYFYLYLMTNPHTNLCGCYEISERQIENETGYQKKTVDKLIERMCVIHKVIAYSKETKEVLIVNWHKYNWTASEKFRKPLAKEIQSVKNTDFREYLSDLLNGIDTVSIPYTYRIDTTCIDTTVTVTDTDIYINNNTNNKEDNRELYFPEDEVMNGYFMEYVAYRKEKKNKLTDRSAQMAIKKLKEYATVNGVFDRERAREIIERSIANGWTGLFQLDDKKSNQSKNTKIHNFEERPQNYSELERIAFGE